MSFWRVNALIVWVVLFVSLIMSMAHASIEPMVEQNDVLNGSAKQEVDALEKNVKERRERIKELEGLIGGYKEKIKQHEDQQASLQNELGLLENRVQEKRAGIERAKHEIEATTLEIQSIEIQITTQKKRISQRESLLADLFLQLQNMDGVNNIQAFLANPSLSDYLVRVDEVARLEGDLGETTQLLRSEKNLAEAKRRGQDERRQALEIQKQQLQSEQVSLEQDQAGKSSLLDVTASKEAEFQKIIYELRQQQQSDAAEVDILQDKLKERLDSIEQSLARGDILLNWPLHVVRKVSANFHDPSYPFRHLFEHPGMDLPTLVGTPVRAAAGGYVAWTRTGKQYGNYVMIVHAGGVATVYAHLSRFAVRPDGYVERGDVIGYSGGRPGDQGAGLSTGPHLHFEVRQNGIPVDPRQFLPD